VFERTQNGTVDLSKSAIEPVDQWRNYWPERSLDRTLGWRLSSKCDFFDSTRICFDDDHGPSLPKRESGIRAKKRN
jgi:hypothetical protein